MTFKTSLDSLSKVVTIGISLLFISIECGQILLLKENISNQGAWVTICIFPFIYFITYLFRPLSYELNTTHLIIKRPIGKVIFQKENIVSVVKIESKMLHGVIRTFGVGGLFGYYGYYYNKTIGKMSWYATRRDRAVLITTHNNQKILVTPDDVEGFINAFKK